MRHLLAQEPITQIENEIETLPQVPAATSVCLHFASRGMSGYPYCMRTSSFVGMHRRHDPNVSTVAALDVNDEERARMGLLVGRGAGCRLEPVARTRQQVGERLLRLGPW
jgi:hypothetical protein